MAEDVREGGGRDRRSGGRADESVNIEELLRSGGQGEGRDTSLENIHTGSKDQHVEAEFAGPEVGAPKDELEVPEGPFPPQEPLPPTEGIDLESPAAYQDNDYNIQLYPDPRDARDFGPAEQLAEAVEEDPQDDPEGPPESEPPISGAPEDPPPLTEPPISGPPVTDPPEDGVTSDLNFLNAEGYEDGQAAVAAQPGADDGRIDIGSTIDLSGIEGDDFVSEVTFGNIPAGVTVHLGDQVIETGEDGSLTLSGDSLQAFLEDQSSLQVELPTHSDADFTLDASVTVSDPQGDSQTFEGDVEVVVDAVADMPDDLSATVSQQLIGGGDDDATATLSVTNEGQETAAFHNTYGYYIMDDDGNPTSGQIIFADTKDSVGESFSIEGVDPDRVGYFIIPDGDSHNQGLTNGMDVTFQQDEDGNWNAFGPDGNMIRGDGSYAEAGIQQSTFFSDSSLNPDGIEHVTDNETRGGQNWEDLIDGVPGFDGDYDDVNMTVNLAVEDGGQPPEPQQCLVTINVETTFGDTTDGSEEHYLYVEVPMGMEPYGDNVEVVNGSDIEGFPADTQFVRIPADSIIAEQGESVSVPVQFVSPVPDEDGTLEVKVFAEAIETDLDGKELTLDNNRALVESSVTIEKKDMVVEGVDLDTEPAAGYEDQAIALDIDIQQYDTDSSEQITEIVISDVPEGATLSAGTDNGDGTWTLTTDQIEGLEVTPPADSDVDFTLNVSVTTEETNTGETKIQSAPLKVTVDAVADETSLSGEASDEVIQEGGDSVHITVNIDAQFGDTTDGSEEHFVYVEVPEGMTAVGDVEVVQGGDGMEPGTYVKIPVDNATIGEDGSVTVPVTFEAPPLTDESTVTVDVYSEAIDTESDGSLTDENNRTLGHNTVTVERDDLVVEGVDLDTEPAAGYEDQAIALDIDIAQYDTDSSETITEITISDVPEGATLSAGTDNGDGTWTLTSDQIEGLEVTPPQDSDVDFTLNVSVTTQEESTGETKTQSAPLKVTVDAVADETSLSGEASDEVIQDGGDSVQITISVDAQFGDTTDGSEEHFVYVEVPEGMTTVGDVEVVQGGGDTGMNEGTYVRIPVDNATIGEDGSVTVPVTFEAPPLTDESTVTVDVYSEAIDTETDGSLTDENNRTLGHNTVTVERDDLVVEGVDLDTEPAAGYEDQAIALDIDIAQYDTDSSETITEITISDVPEGATLSAGTDNGDGTWTLTSDQIEGLEVTPPQDSDVDFTLNVSVTTQEESTGETKTQSAPLKVTVDAVADETSLSGEASDEVIQDGGDSVQITISVDAQFGDTTDGSEEHFVYVEVPDGMTAVGDVEVVQGGDGMEPGTYVKIPVDNATIGEDGSVTVPVTFEAPPLTDESTVTVDVYSEAIDTETDGSLTDENNRTLGHNTVTVERDDLVVEGVDLDTEPAAGYEDQAIALDIDIAQYDTDSSETITEITISDVPEGATLSAGTDNGDGTWTLTSDQIEGLEVTPPQDSDVDFTLNVSVTTQEESTGETKTQSAPLKVTVDAVADETSLTGEASDEVIQDGGDSVQITVNIDASFGDTTDGSEEHFVYVEVPEGMTAVGDVEVVQGGGDTGMNEGTYVRIPVDNATIGEDGSVSVPVTFEAPPSTDESSMTIDVYSEAIDTETDGSLTDENNRTLGHNTVTVERDDLVVEGPDLKFEHAEGYEDNAIPLSIDIEQFDTDGSETITNITISDVPEGASLSVGTDNGDGTWTIPADQIGELSVTPPEESDVDFTLNVSVTVQEESTGETKTVSAPLNVTVDAVADEVTVEAGVSTQIVHPPAEDYEPVTGTIDASNFGDTDSGFTVVGRDITGEVDDDNVVLDGGRLGVGGAAMDGVVPNQIGHNAETGESEALIVEFDNDVTQVEFSVSNLFKDEGAKGGGAGHEQGKVILYRDGEVVGEMEFTAIKGNNQGTYTVEAPDGGTFDRIEFAATDYTEGAGETDSSDYFVTQINFTEAPPDDAGGGEPYCEVTVDVQATFGDYEDGSEEHFVYVQVPMGMEPADENAVVVDGGGESGLPEGQYVKVPVDAADIADGNGAVSVPVTFNAPVPDEDGQIPVNVFAETVETNLDGGELTTANNRLVAGDTVTIDKKDMVVEGSDLDTEDSAGYEDQAIALDIDVTQYDTDGSEQITAITISDVPEGAELSAGTDNGDGTWTVTQDQLEGLTVTPPADSDEDFTLNVSVTTVETNTGEEKTVSAPINVTVDAVADDVGVSASVSAEVVTGDAGEPHTVTIDAESFDEEGLGFTIGAATLDDEGNLSEPSVDNISVRSEGRATGLGVKGDASNGADSELGHEDGKSEQLVVSFDEDVSEATVQFAWMNSKEGATVTLYRDGEPVGEVEIRGGSDGIDPPVTFEADDGGTFDQIVFSAPTENDDYLIHNISFEAPGEPEQHCEVTVDVQASFGDYTDGSEEHFVFVEIPMGMTPITEGEVVEGGGDTGLPEGNYLKIEVDPETIAEGGGTVTVPVQFEAPVPDDDGTISVGVFAAAVETNLDGGELTTDNNMVIKGTSVDIDKKDMVVEGADLEVEDSAGYEDQAIALDIDVTQYDTDGSEVSTITISGVPEGAELSAGTDNGDGTWTLTTDQVDGLTVTPPADSDADFQLGVSVTTVETNSGEETTVSETIDVTVDAVADDVGVSGTASDPAIQDGGDSVHITVNVDASFGDFDGSEEHFVYIEVPEGMTAVGEGVETVQGGGDTGMNPGTYVKIPVPNDSVGEDGSVTVPVTFEAPAATEESSMQIDVYAEAVETVTDGEITTENNRTIEGNTVTIGQEDIVVEGVDLDTDPAAGYEDTAIGLDIDIAQYDTDGSEQISSITISDVPEGAQLSAGTDNGDGTWTLSSDQVEGLTVTPPADSDHDFTLNVSVTTVETNTGEERTQSAPLNVTVDAVADETTVDADYSATVVQGEGGELDFSDVSITITNPGQASAGFHNTYGYYVMDDDGNPTSGQIVFADMKDTVGDSFTLEGVDPDKVGFFLIPNGDQVNEGLQDGMAVTFEQDGDGNWHAVGPDGNALEGDASWKLPGNQNATFFSDSSLNPDGIDHVTDNEHVGNQNWEDLIQGAPGFDADYDDINVQVTVDGEPVQTGEARCEVTITVDASFGDHTDGSEEHFVYVEVPMGMEPVGEGIEVVEGGGDTGMAPGTYVKIPVDDSQIGEDGSVSVEVTFDSPVPDEDGSMQVDVYAEAVETNLDGGELTTDNNRFLSHDTVTIDKQDIVVSGVDLEVEDATVTEDQTVELNIDVTQLDTDGSEVTTVTISGVPEGAELSAGTDNGDGTWTLEPEQLEGLEITPPEDSDVDFTLDISVTTVETETGEEKTVTQSLDVTVIADADVPTVEAEDATGLEDTPVPLDIGSALTDTDGSESLSITISNVPEGASLNHGTDNGDGTWTLTEDQLDGLEITPPKDFAGSFDLKVSATATEGENNDQETSVTDLTVTIEADADTPSVSIEPAQGYEDNAIAIDIDAATTDIDGSESIQSIVISGVPEGAELSAGTDNGDGTWTLTEDQLDGLSVTPPTDSDHDFQLEVTVTAVDSNGDTATNTATVDVTVDAVADDVSVDASVSATLVDVPGDPDFEPRTGTIDTSNFGDTDSGFRVVGRDLDGEENIDNVSHGKDGLGVNDDASKGEPDGQIGHNPETGESEGLIIEFDNNVSEVSFQVSRLFQDEGDGRGDAAGDEQGKIILYKDGEVVGEMEFTAESGNTGSYTVELPDGQTFDKIEFTATEYSEGDGTQTHDSSDYFVKGVTFTEAPADQQDGGGEQYCEISVDVNASFGDFTDGSEEHFVFVEIPDGMTPTSEGEVVQGGGDTGMPEGNYLKIEVDPADIQAGNGSVSVSVTFEAPVPDEDGAMDIGVYAAAVETNLDGGELTTSNNMVVKGTSVTVQKDDVVVEGSDLEVENAAGYEDQAIALDIDVTQHDTDGSEVATITVSGVPEGAELSAGTDNGDGTWTLTTDQVEGLTVTPPADSDGDFTLNVSVTTTETGSGESTTVSQSIDVTVDAVADETTVSADITCEVIPGEPGDPETVVIDAESFDDPGLGFSIGASTLDKHGNLSEPSMDNVSVKSGGSATGLGVKGDASNGADSELGHEDGKSEQLVVTFDEDVSEASVQFAWMNSKEGATVTLMRDGEVVGEVEIRGGSDKIDPAVTFEADDGGTFDQIVFSAPTENDDYLIHNITFEAPADGEPPRVEVTVDVDATFGDYADGSENHYVLVEVPEGMEVVGEGVETVDSSTIPGAPAGGQFVKVPVDAATLAEGDGSVTVPVTFTGPANEDGSAPEIDVKVYAQAVETDLDGNELTEANNSSITGAEAHHDGVPAPVPDDVTVGTDDGDDEKGGPQGNNGWGNGDQDAPGGSEEHNNAENDKDGREDPRLKNDDDDDDKSSKWSKKDDDDDDKSSKWSKKDDDDDDKSSKWSKNDDDDDKSSKWSKNDDDDDHSSKWGHKDDDDEGKFAHLGGDSDEPMDMMSALDKLGSSAPAENGFDHAMDNALNGNDQEAADPFGDDTGGPDVNGGGGEDNVFGADDDDQDMDDTEAQLDIPANPDDMGGGVDENLFQNDNNL